MATIDHNGLCLLSDVNTNKYNFHLKMEQTRTFRGNIFNVINLITHYLIV